MADSQTVSSVLDAVERYFDLMFDANVDCFDQVFAQSAQLHGFREANLRQLTSKEYKAMLSSNPSPKSKNAPRLQEILMVDVASPTQALAKVRVRVDAIQYLDYLCYHRIEGQWLITAKSFHVEQRFQPAA